MDDKQARLENAKNPYQTTAKRVLCVCSAGMLRSDTAAKLLWQEYGYNTRSCGVREYCLIPFDDVLATWADEIVVADTEHLNPVLETMKRLKLEDTPVKCLHLPDNYTWMADQLQKMIIQRYKP